MMEEKINLEDLANKLFCTFTTKEELDSTVDTIKDQYDILFNKIFVLFVESTNEYVCTYNVDSFNMSNTILDNTILLHRKKDSNTLYTINALNDLIKELNGGILDMKYKVNWSEYRNCILLTTGGELKRLDTKVHDILTF
jgi:hypothetical protein|tara:strand:- start:531 stop:950 length:420 start_codon:yes stop_codon:yes gene_type:complete